MTPTETAQPNLYEIALISFAHGKSRDAVLKELTAEGLNATYARTLADEALRAKKAVFRKAGLFAMLKGAAVLFLGLVVTVISYSMNLPVYIVATGPILYGGILFFKGLFQAIAG